LIVGRIAFNDLDIHDLQIAHSILATFLGSITVNVVKLKRTPILKAATPTLSAKLL
jgi:hypothetical protein